MVQCLKASDAWLPPSGVVAMFGGAKSEPDLLPLIPWLSARGVGVAFFGIEEDTMHPYRVGSTEDLRVGKFGVLEPSAREGTRLAVADLGVVLTPGLAFESAHGHRMGRGAGYYDRFFSNPECRAKRIGVGFSLQFCDTLAIEEHDIPMQAFVTEHGWMDVPTPATS
ncbi:MAG: hypothetical protein RL693_1952 [Verrucomicrobiota bacterium]